MKKQILLVIITVLMVGTAYGQQAGRPRKVPTKPATPCNARDFVAADDTGLWWGCNPSTLLWNSVTIGSTPVAGPASSTDNAAVRFDGSTGKLIQNSGVIIDDSNNISGVGSLAGAPTIPIKLTETAPGAASVALAGAGAGNVDNGAHTVKVTCLTAGGETTAGTVSGTVTVVDKTADGKVAITSIPLCSAIATGRNIYMTTVPAPTVYKLLSNGAIANNTATTLTANDSDATLAASTTAPSTNTAIDARLTVGQSVITPAVPVTIPNGSTATTQSQADNSTKPATTSYVDTLGATKQATISFGTGVLTALGVNVGTAGSPVLNGGALGSPSSAGTLPPFTLGGTITGGSQQVNSLGNVGLFATPASLAGVAHFLDVAGGTSAGVDFHGTNNWEIWTGGAGDFHFYSTTISGGDAMVIAATTGAVTLSKTAFATTNLTNAAGTPGSLCYNTSTFEITKNNALTCTVSSRKFKTGILGLPVSGFDKLRPVQFTYRDHPDRLRYGFIAEEAGAADQRFADGYDAAGNPTSIDQNAILAATVAEVQQLKQQMSLMGTKLAAQQRTISRLRRRRFAK